MRKPDEVFVEFVGNPDSDNFVVSRLASKVRFEPTAPNAEVFHCVEKWAYDLTIQTIRELIYNGRQSIKNDTMCDLSPLVRADKLLTELGEKL